MQKLWAEVCSNCQKTLDECNLEPFDKLTGTGGFEIHHTRNDLGMTNENVTRFMCHSCNHKSELRRK